MNNLEPRCYIDKVPVYCAFDEIAEITCLKENPKNPNTHPEVQIELLAEIIKKTGWRAPITVSTLSGMIVKGHGRLQAAIKAGLTHVPVEYQNFEDNEEEIAALLADNKMAEFAEIDRSQLLELFEDFNMENLNLTGYTQEDLQKYFEDYDVDEIPEDIPLDKEKADSTRLDFLAYGTTRIILTEEEKARLDAVIKRYGDVNGNLFGFIAEVLENGAHNYEN